jgi:hypothetical protein
LQVPFSCTPSTYLAVEQSLAPARLTRYLPASKGDRDLALRLYVWNAHLCAEFYLPLQTAEICVRNVIQRALINRYGRGWYSRSAFIDVLPERYRAELFRKVRDEQTKRQSAFTGDHVVATMPFGFWVQLLTSGFEHLLWTSGIRTSFPGAPRGMERQGIYDAVEKLRHFRNKVAHHYAIFDLQPLDQFRNATTVIDWISPDTGWFVKQLVNPQAAMAKRPR